MVAKAPCSLRGWRARISLGNPSARAGRRDPAVLQNPANPLAHTELGKTVAAACELFERSTRRYSKPEWRVDSTLIGGERVPVHI